MALRSSKTWEKARILLTILKFLSIEKLYKNPFTSIL